MRVRHVLVCGYFFMLLAGVVSAGSHDDALMKEVEALGNALEVAIIEDDIDFILGAYAEDAISLPNFSPRQEGLAEFRAHHDQMSATGMKITSFESEPTDVWECGKQVIEIGKYTISLVMPGAPQPINDTGKYLTVYVRQADGSLKIKVETWNTDVNPMAMGGGEHERGHEHEHEHEHGEH